MTKGQLPKVEQISEALATAMLREATYVLPSIEPSYANSDIHVEFDTPELERLRHVKFRLELPPKLRKAIDRRIAKYRGRLISNSIPDSVPDSVLDDLLSDE